MAIKPNPNSAKAALRGMLSVIYLWTHTWLFFIIITVTFLL